ncbi:polyprenyl synthetase family protein [Oxalobacter sp. OttesenSCG-928-P03]|nr:polyprenyl synthetase family protein [Oxalobacter sp. OttesenSCG-928-P03]
MSAPIPFEDWMQSVQTTIEDALSKLLPSSTRIPERLHDAMRYATLDGGKRVRPMLVFAAGTLFDAPVAAMAHAGSAVEMIHAYSLVHDDLPCMDNDVLRRGKPTVHVRYDEATALLAGDALQSQAFMVLSRIDADPERTVEMLQILSEAAGSFGMCGGQAIDLASVGQDLSLEQLEQMHGLKTGALLEASVFLGCLCGRFPGADEARALEAYTRAVGLAFQVVDDILDATADSETLGKTAGKDAADNKPTYVSILGLEKSRALAEKLRSDAHQALNIFDEKAGYLRQLADLIVERNK